MTILLVLAYISVFVAALSSIAFPFLYSQSAWRKSPAGRALMQSGVAVAVAVNMTAMFVVTPPGPVLGLVLNILGFSLLATSSIRLSWLVYHTNYLTPKETDNGRIHPSHRADDT